jgi:hypothetical protein
MQLTSRTAVHADISALVPLMRTAIDQLQKEFLDEAQVAAMASLAGATLYRAAGIEPIEEVMDDSGGVPVPLVRMAKRISD